MASVFLRQVYSRLPSPTCLLAASAAAAVCTASEQYALPNQNTNNSSNLAACEAIPTTTIGTSNLQRRMTPIGRFAVASESPMNPSIVTFFMKLHGKEKPLSAVELSQLWQEKAMPSRHPRFHQIVQPNLTLQPEDPTTQHWIETTYPANKDDIRKRLQYMQMNRWDLKDSLWYMSVGTNQTTKNESMALFRGHHALADGVSMIAALTDLFDERDELKSQIEIKLQEYNKLQQEKKKKLYRHSFFDRLWRYWVQMVKFLVGAWLVVSHQVWLVVLNAVWDNHPWKRLKQQCHSRMVPPERTVAWSDIAPLEDMKRVAKRLGSSVTVNDVMVSCATAALARQLEFHRMVQTKDGLVVLLPIQTSVHVAVPVHLKGGVILPHESLGNHIGAFVARVPCELSPSRCPDVSLYRLETVHAELTARKHTPVAWMSYLTAAAFSYLAHILPLSYLFSVAHAGSILVVSNNRGPDQPLHIAGREIEQMYGFVPLPPEIPIGLVVQSYAGIVSCTLAAEPWAVPDGDQFLIWMMEEYKQLAHLANAQL